MKIGFIGLGKLGFPCATAINVRGGHEIFGYDIDPNVVKIYHEKKAPYVEKEFEEYLTKSQIVFSNSILEVAEISEIIFIAVQTPHDKLYEGVTPTPTKKMDFDYSILCNVVDELADALSKTSNNPLIVVISTVLPGTMRKYVLPKLNKVRSDIKFCYNPYFIAMGTTISDFLEPEYVLIGSDSKEAALMLQSFYQSLHTKESIIMEIESAELTKVAYNTFIGFKIIFANTISEIVQVTGGNCDEVTNALAKANKRLMSHRYLSAGMGDGGGCHPRDQIAMSWLAEKAGLSSDIFGWIARTRDLQTRRFAELINSQLIKFGIEKVCLLGLAYKPNTSLTVGSPALLLSHYLDEFEISYEIYDPFVNSEKVLPVDPSLFFVSTNHDYFNNLELPAGSVVIDPWDSCRNRKWGNNVTSINPGRP